MPRLSRHKLWLCASCVASCLLPSAAVARAPYEATVGGGAVAHEAIPVERPERQRRQVVTPPPAPVAATPEAPVARARVIGGQATAPAGAPQEVVAAIAAANKIVAKPYRYGGGHARSEDTGYDCSGTISYALTGADLLKAPLDSTSFMRWGESGRGRWITVYSNPSHAYVVIAGIRLDTSAGGRSAARFGSAPGSGPRWRGSRSSRGYQARHFPGL